MMTSETAPDSINDMLHEFDILDSFFFWNKKSIKRRP